MTKAFQTFADAATATGLVDRELVFVSGSATVGDTGQGHFIFRSTGTGSASNDIIVVTAGGRMFRATDPSDALADALVAAMQAGTQPISAASLPLPTSASTAANQAAEQVLLGAVTETAPVSDAASSGLNGRLQRVAQRITSLIAQIPATLGGKTAAASLSVTTATDDPTNALTGAVTETAPASDTASSGLNGRLQRIAQRLTALIALYTLPTLTNRSGTVTTGGTAQNVMSSNASRRSGTITNLHATSAWVSEIGTAATDTAGSVELAQGGVYTVEGVGAVSYLHPTTGAKFTALEG